MTSYSLKRTLFALLLMCLVGFTAQQARASHLRGQTISWAPTANLGEVEFTFNYSERYTASFPTLGSSFSVSISFGDGLSGVATGPVTSINTTDDYFIAVLKVKHTYAGPGPYTAFYNNCCRISTIKDGHDQTIQLQTTVTPRNGNHSPVTSLPVVVTVATTGAVQFTIPAADIDGDRLRFRLATSLESFATASPVGFTTQPPGFSVDQNTGVVTWNTSAISPAPIAGDLWASQIMIEDLDSSGNVRSKVPVDFILKFVAAVGHVPTITLNPTGPITASANTPVSFTVTGNDVDNNARVTLNASGMPAGASMSPALGATLSPPVTSTFSWTPTLAQAGATGQTYVINFTATDDTNQQALTSITINVLPAGAPTANSQSVTATSGVPKLITLSATDPNGSNLSFTITGSPAHGAITNIGAPSCSLSGGVSTCTVNVTYTSNSGYSGPDTFSFRASNGVQNSNAATVNVTVNPGNRPPVATDSSITTNEDTSVPVPLQASDPDGNALTYVILSGPANGMLTGIGSSRTYLPNPNYNGADSFTFKVNDGAVDSNTATVSITINSVNDPPVAANDSYSIVAGLMLSVASPGVLSNDSDIDSSSLNAIVDAGPSHGTLTLNANGSFNYLPNPGYVGSDNFTYHANDGGANSGPATVAITVSAPDCVNHPSDLVAWYPANGNVFDVMGGNQAALQNGATFAAGMVGQAFDLNNDGNATNQASSDIVRVPRTSSLEPQRLSVDAWVYARSYLWDSEGGVIISKDTVGTSAGDGASYALIGPGTTQKFNAYVRFTDGTQPRIISTHAFALNQWHHVAMTWDGNTLKLYVDGNEEASTTTGPRTIAYSNHDLGIGKHSTAARGFDGLIDEVEVFSRALSASEVQSLYNASSAGKCNTVAVAQDQSVTTNEDTAVNITLTATDADGNFLNYSVVDGPTNGTLSGTAPNLTYTPNSNYNGADSFTFKVNDGFSDSNTATVSINVNAVNDPPTASCRNLTLATSGGGAACPAGEDCKKGGGAGTKHCKAGDPTCIPTVGSCLLNVSGDQVDNGSSDPDGDELTYTLSPAGPFTVGTTAVTLTVTDPAGASSSCTANVTVIDDTLPIPIVSKIADVTGECSVTVTPPTAIDDCAGTIQGTTTDPLTYNQPGTYSITWTYDDGHGNVTTQNQQAIVQDTTPPVVPNLPGSPQTFTWVSANTPAGAPSARIGHAMVYDPVHAKVILFGGEDSQTINNDIWELDSASNIWTNVTPASDPMPSPRFYAAMAFEPSNGNVLLFGGQLTNLGPSIAGDTWEWDTTNHIWSLKASSSVIGNRLGSAMAYDPNLHQMILFGGRDFSSFGSTLTQTFAWSGTTWQQLAAPVGPIGRYTQGMVTDTARSKIVMFGGYNGNLLGDTWEWNGGSWTLVAPNGSGPFMRSGPGLAYDSGRQRTVLFGGSTGQSASDTWEWNGNVWTQVQTQVSPSGRSTPLVYDNAQAKLVLFGGDSFAQLTDTWYSQVTSGLPTVMGECSASVTRPTATDNCVGPVIGTTNDPTTYNQQGTYTVHWIYDDGHGNSSTQTQTVIVKDVTKPAPNVASLPDVTGECSATIPSAPTASDNCAGTITGTTNDPLTCSNQGTFVVHWIYDDGHGNISNQDQNVIVRDVTKPVPNVASLPDVTGECSATIPSAPTASDNCAGTITGTTNDPLTYSNQGTFVVHWTYDDGHGNISTQDQNVIVRDVTKPVPNVASLPDVTGECSATIPSAPTASDNCAGTITGTTNDPLTYSDQGTFVVHWNFDDGHGNISTQDQNVIVKDVTKPVPNVASLPDITGECSATIPSPPTATDNCAGSITGTTTDPLAYTEQGTFTVTWHYSDGHGNESTQTQTVIVKDTTPPALNVPVDVTVNTGAGATSCSALVPDSMIGSATATDNCELQSLIRTGVPAGNIFPVGTTVVTYTASDIHGKITTKTQRVTVVDDTIPVLNVPPNITIGTTADASSCTAFVNNAMLTPTATDNCGVDVNSFTRTGVPAGNNFPVGITLVTYTVKDVHGNLATGTQSVTVTDATLPVIYLTGKTITLWPPDHKYQTIKITDLIAAATDNCDPNVALSKVVIAMVTSDEPENINSGDGNTINDIVIAPDCKSVDLRAERDGSRNGRVYTIYFQVKDSAGNVQTAKATVTVPKSQGPGGAAIDDTPAYPLPPPYKVMGSCPP